MQFEGAYRMIADLEDMNFKPTTNMYNAIMAGYFREKNIRGGLRVLNQMRGANVKPDSHTFYYLIQNCETEEDIIKCVVVGGSWRAMDNSVTPFTLTYI
ncbi:Pentatricopeptide repeat-containing protein, mitochondrial [Glycine soja]|uniref:Pentatricopeptide repeat-containing protein, mitochondrial n=1 Tax=Glycine soja TaxID=3848 RepID=A0A0B2SQM6_GLYSO|nr:Pentatricopeptide repeat-containing protein, mitochondrial [Glycine soja]